VTVSTAGPDPYRHVEHVMGTVVSIDIRDRDLPPADATGAIAEVVAWLHHVDATYSPYRPDSIVSRLGHGGTHLDDLDPDVRAVLAAAHAWTTRSGGTFTLHPGGHLDPSGYVKGWAVERAADLLTAAGSRAHSVNGGGDIQTVGHAGEGRPWRLGITDPHHPGALAAVAEGYDLAVATSGTAERGPHIIDPRTGRPATALASITVTGTRLADVDAAATAAFVHGPDAPSWLATQPGLAAFAITSTGEAWSTPGFPHAQTAPSGPPSAGR
jgi:thiamine biosynthesis lipoprotein